MMMQPVNLFAVFASGVVYMVIGYVWYGPLFGASWMKAMGMRKDAKVKQSDMMTTMGTSFVASLLMGYVLAQFIVMLGARDVVSGALLGGMGWLGFMVPLGLTTVLFEKRKGEVFLYNIGYHLVALLAMGALLANFA